jgi:TP901 family phage tail tape measure protein
MGIQVGSAFGKIEIDFTSIKRGVEEAGKQLSTFEAKTKQIGQQLKSAGDQMTAAITLPLAALGVASSKASMDFEASMQQIVGLVGVSQEQVNAWSKDLTKLGPELSKGPKELADALYQVTSSGIANSDALGVVRDAAKAAAAGLGETKVIADATTSAMNAYRTSNLDSATATGILVAAVREGKGEAADFAPALGRVVPIAAEMGISFDQVAAAMASMTLVGFDASESATNLSGIMTAFLKPSKQASDILAEFGLSGEQLRAMASKPGGLLDVLTVLRDTVGQDDEALSKIFPNVRGFRGMLSLVGENAQQVNGIFKELAVAGVADLDKAFNAASQTAKFQFNAAMSSVQSSLIAFGNAVLPVVIPILKSLAETIQNVTRWFGELGAGTQQTIVQVLLIAAALGPVLSIGGRLIGTLGTMVSLVQSVGGAFMTAAKFAGGFARTAFEVGQYLVEAGAAGFVVVGAFAAVVVGIIAMIKFFDAASRAAKATNDELIKMANSNTGNVIEDAFNRAGASFELIINGSKRLKDVFVAHQVEMRRKLNDGEITLQQYNAEIERSAKVAGVWSTQFVVGQGNVTRIDSAVKILTADQLQLENAQYAVMNGAYGLNGALDESGRAARRTADETERLSRAAYAVNGNLDESNRAAWRAAKGHEELSNSTQDSIDKANAFAEAQKKATEEAAAAETQLNQLKALIDGAVGSAYDDFTSKQDDLKQKMAKVKDELDKLNASQNSAITTTKKHTLTENEATLAKLQLEKAQRELSAETAKGTLTVEEAAAAQAKVALNREKLDGVTKSQIKSSKQLTAAQQALKDAQTELNNNTDPMKQAKLAVEVDKLQEKLGQAAGAVQGYVDNSKKIGELQGQFDDLNKEIADNATAWDEHLKRVLFDMATEQLAANGLTQNEVTALTTIAEKWGLIDKATADATLAVLGATSQLAADGNMQAFAANMQGALDKTKTAAENAQSGVVNAVTPIGEAYAETARRAESQAKDVEIASRSMADNTSAATAHVKATLDRMERETRAMPPIEVKVQTTVVTTEEVRAAAGDSLAERRAQAQSAAGQTATVVEGTTQRVTATVKKALEDVEVAGGKMAQAVGSNSEKAIRAAGSAAGQTMSYTASAVNAASSSITRTGGTALTTISQIIARLLSIPRDITVRVRVIGDNIPGRAAGGPVTAGQVYIVGEKRPELFVPSVGGTIVPRVGEESLRSSGLMGKQTQVLNQYHYENYFYDALATKAYLDEQRLRRIREMQGAM